MFSKPSIATVTILCPDSEEVVERLDASLADEFHDLAGVPPRGGIRDGPCGFLLDVEFGVCEKIDERRYDIVVVMTAWICSRLPAVMFEIVQQASFLIPLRGLESREREGTTARDS